MSSQEFGTASKQGTVFATFHDEIHVPSVVDAETSGAQDVYKCLEEKTVCHEAAQVAPRIRTVHGEELLCHPQFVPAESAS